MEILLEPPKITRFFAGIVLLLALAHLAAQFSIYVLGYDNLFGLIPLFSLNAEENIPALYSSLALVFCALLLALIAWATKRSGRPYFRHWAGLSAIFLFLGMDESLSFHESSTVPLRKALDTSGALFYAWIIPYGLFLAVLLAVYARFLLRLPGETRRAFLLAAGLYVSGAMLFEIPGGIYDEAFGRHTPLYSAISTLEELLEMGGIVVFIRALAAYLAARFPTLAVRIASRSDLPSTG